MPETIKIGDKQKHLRVPDGWRRVTTGVVRVGDQCANVANTNRPFWEPILKGDEDVGAPVEDLECVIRPKNTVPT